MQLLPEWEGYLGLPECGTTVQTFEMRRAAVVEKYHRKGGLQTWMIEADRRRAWLHRQSVRNSGHTMCCAA